MKDNRNRKANNIKVVSRSKTKCCFKLRHMTDLKEKYGNFNSLSNFTSLNPKDGNQVDCEECTLRLMDRKMYELNNTSCSSGSLSITEDVKADSKTRLLSDSSEFDILMDVLHDIEDDDL